MMRDMTFIKKLSLLVPASKVKYLRSVCIKFQRLGFKKNYLSATFTPFTPNLEIVMIQRLTF